MSVDREDVLLDAKSPERAAAGGMLEWIDEFDWRSTPLGARSCWPSALRAPVELMLRMAQPAGVCLGPDLVMLYNDAAGALLGDLHPRALGRPARATLGRVWPSVGPEMASVLSSGRALGPVRLRATLERGNAKKDAWLEYAVSPVPGESGETVGVLVLVADVTAAVRAEEERERAVRSLREERERLELAIEAADLGVWDYDFLADDVSNRSLRHDQLFGFRELQTKWDSELAAKHLVPEDVPVFRAALERAVETGVFDPEVRARWPDGTEHWIAPLGRVFYDADGRAVRMAGVVSDVSDRKNAEAERRALERALDEQVAKERRRLARELHDGLRQELVGMQMLSSRLAGRLRERAAPEAIMMQEFAELAREMNGHLRDLISGLVPVRVTVDSLVPALQRAAGNVERWYGLHCSVHGPRDVVFGDVGTANHVFHIAQEAMVNAAKHAQASAIEVRLEVEGPTLLLTVRDDGVGLPEDFDRRGGMGVVNLRTRAALIGAELSFGSDASSGTCLSCRVTL